jgi:hypothetical protein
MKRCSDAIQEGAQGVSKATGKSKLDKEQEQAAE